MRRFLVSMAGIVVLIIILSPLVTGFIIEQYYYRLVRAFPANMGWTVSLKSFQRGWFHSQALFNIKTPTQNFTLQQDIEQGPFFWNKPYGMGLAAIHNTTCQLPPWLQGFCNHQDKITLTGAYFKHINFKNRESVPFSFDGNIWVWPERVVVNGTFRDLQLKSPEEGQWSISEMFFNCDLRLSDHHLWLGHHSIEALTILWQKEGKELLALDHLKLHGEISETQNTLSGKHELAVSNIHLNNESIGPLTILLNYENINANAIYQLGAAYQKIKTRGELYQSQLQQKMLLLLPLIVNPGSKLAVNEVSLKTKDGFILMNGFVLWPLKHEPPDDIEQFLDDAQMKMKMQVSKKLVHPLAGWIAASILFKENSSPVVNEKTNEKNVERDLNEFLTEGIHRGFIKEDNDNYLMTFTQP